MIALAGLSWGGLLVLWAGAFLGAAAAGGAGFAFAIAASAVWLHVLDPVRTTTLVVACGTILHAALVWPMRRSIEPARLAPFALGGLLGIPAGVAILRHADVGGLKLGLGVFLLLYGAYALLAPRLPVVTAGGKAADGAVGFAGGLLGGIGGYSGVLPTIWTQLRGWPKSRARGVYQPFILLAHATTLALLGTFSLDGSAVLLILLALPALALGAAAGWMLYGRIDEGSFRRVLAVLLFASGLVLVV